MKQKIIDILKNHESTRTDGVHGVYTKTIHPGDYGKIADAIIYALILSHETETD